jgi:exonuclease SbcD
MGVAKFLHAADLHLGAPLESLGESIDSVSFERVKSLVNRAFDRLVDVAIEEDVEFVVLASRQGMRCAKVHKIFGVLSMD